MVTLILCNFLKSKLQTSVKCKYSCPYSIVLYRVRLIFNVFLITPYSIVLYRARLMFNVFLTTPYSTVLYRVRLLMNSFLTTLLLPHSFVWCGYILCNLRCSRLIYAVFMWFHSSSLYMNVPVLPIYTVFMYIFTEIREASSDYSMERSFVILTRILY